ncbi:acyl-homoserine-lactone synthase [Burkholderia sp. AW49-1]
MPSIIAGRLIDLPFELRDGLGTFRYDVFVRRLGWPLPDIKENETIEWDHFDGENTIQIVALTSQQQVCGCARLMPTTCPYLLRELLARSPKFDLPSSSTVWELSRFAGSSMQFFPYAMAVAASLGATCIIGAVTHAIARLYRRFGLELHHAGPGHGTPSFPFLICTIDLTPVTFAKLGSDLETLQSSITWLRPFTSHVPC